VASKNKQFKNLNRGTFLAQRTRVADSFVSRFCGLLFSPPLQNGEGLLIVPCNSIHMFGMKFALDVVFFNKDWSVVGIVEGIKPGQLSKMYRDAHSCVELPCGAIAESETQVGDKFEVLDVLV
jgi:uncharacterized protein